MAKKKVKAKPKPTKKKAAGKKKKASKKVVKKSRPRTARTASAAAASTTVGPAPTDTTNAANFAEAMPVEEASPVFDTADDLEDPGFVPY